MRKISVLVCFLLIFNCANLFAKSKKRNFQVTHNKKGFKGKLWTYSGKFGPSRWSKISDEFSECRKGKEQSPINISGVTEGDNQEVIFKYRPSNLKVTNNGQTLVVPYDKGSTIQIGEESYSLRKMTFHSPSEHRVHGKDYPMEIQLFHMNDSDDQVIISVFIENGKWNQTLHQIVADAPKNSGERRYFPNERLKAEEFLPKLKEYYTYSGSLSSPPCTEDVKRIVLRTPITAGKGQIKSFRQFFINNSRDVQSLNGRTVSYW